MSSFIETMNYNLKSKDLSKMISREKILKCIRWILVIGLTVSAIIFTKDNMVEYAKKRTSFKQYEEARTELPTTVLCFNPFLKTSVLNQYNLEFFDLVYFHTDKMNKSIAWSEFNREAYYEMGTDFNISLIIDNERTILKRGQNYGKNQTATVEKLLTLWTGTCYKISVNYTGVADRIRFKLQFNSSLGREDTPKPEIYLTSEANAYGILGITWLDGNELKFSLKGYDIDLKIKAIKHIYQDQHSNCTSRSYKSCISQVIYNTKLDCAKKCLPLTVPEPAKYWIPYCQDIEDFKCMKDKLHEILYKSAKNICHTNCTTLEYSGKVAYKIDQRVGDIPRNISWTYIFDSRSVEVHEEFLVCGPLELIGYVGGTLGLFIGFSFTEVVNIIINTIGVTYIKLFDVKP